MEHRRSHDVGMGSTAPSGTGTTQRPSRIGVHTHKGPEGQSCPVRTKAEDRHTIKAEEEGDYLIKIENAEEFEEQVEEDNFDGEEMKVDIKEEDLLCKEDSYLTRLDQVPHTKGGKEDLDARPTQEQGGPLLDFAQHLHQDPTQHHSHRRHKSDSVSPPLQGSESQQQYPKVLATFNINSDDRDIYTEPSEETCVTHLLENATSQRIWVTSSSTGSLAPTLSSSRSFYTPVSVKPELLGLESSASGLLCTQARRKRYVKHYEQAIGLALKIVPKDTAMPSYSHCIARAVEIILNECPKDKQMLCGQQILTAALRIQLEMKDKSTSL